MFVELSVTSNFTFLTGGSHPQDYVQRAALMGMTALAVADENSVAGIVRAHVAAREIARVVAERRAFEAEQGLIGPPAPERAQSSGSPEGLPPAPSADIANVPRLIPAARLVTEEGVELTALPRDRAAWGRLTRLITLGRRRAPKGRALIRVSDVLEHGAGMELLLHPPEPMVEGWEGQARRLVRAFGPALALVIAPRYDGADARRFARQAALADRLGLPTVASAEPIMHHARRRRLVDVLTAIREGRRVDDLGRRAQPNAERRLRAEAEMLALFRGHEAAVHRSGEIAARCTFSLDELRYEYPSEISGGETPAARLDRLARAGLAERYPSGAPERVRNMLDHELALISKLGYEPYFLTVNDIVAFARSRGILCQGRGSAANSVVCYALGVTSVSPEIGTMVFERFVSEARDEPPDIDVDFEHERREEVIQ
ncbi:MAG: error-prone DNA polymerase, partial [Maritimibacter sp.]|nr:error-prone DNA polymerase [Maritimibacter sp.]